GRRPVAPAGERATRQRRRVARRQLRDALEDRAPGRRVAEGRVVLERGGVERATHGGVQQQRLGLGGEHEQTVAMPVVERLLAEAVTRQEEPPPSRVPHREGEHAAQPVDARLAVLLPRAQQHLGVDERGVSAAAGLQLAEKVAAVEDLAVEYGRSSYQ